MNTCITCLNTFAIGTVCTHGLECEDVSTMDKESVQALADEALTLAIMHIQRKLGGRPGDIAANMFPKGNAAETLIATYIEAEIDAILDADEAAANICGVTLGRTTTKREVPNAK